MINALILAVGIGLNRLGARLRLRRAERHDADRAGTYQGAEPRSPTSERDSVPDRPSAVYWLLVAWDGGAASGSARVTRETL